MDYFSYGVGCISKYFRDWSLFEKSWLLLFSSVAILSYYISDGTILSLAATLSGILTVVLVAKGRTSNFYFGIVNIVLYGYLSFQAQFYGEVMLNAFYYLPMQYIGLYLWTKNERMSDRVSAARMTHKERGIWAVVSVVSIFLYAEVLEELGGNLPLHDSASTTLSVLAQYLMVRRVKEQWILWFVINIISIYMWSTSYMQTGENLALVVMWSAYLVNSVYGFYNWNRMESDHA